MEASGEEPADLRVGIIRGRRLQGCRNQSLLVIAAGWSTDGVGREPSQEILGMFGKNRAGQAISKITI